jgi:DNA-binding transcriptional MerR regulator
VRIGEVAERAGVSVETLRYYERRGLLPEPQRSVGGHRDYGDDAVRFVRAVKEAQSLGFSLAEIGEYVTTTRRRPGDAPAELRLRLEEKLGDVEERIDALRLMRTNLTRALHSEGSRLEHSASSAGYLARGGRDPALRPDEPLHLTNGESTGATLRRSGLGGVVVAWNDALHEGPLADVPERELRAIRARFLAGHGWGDERSLAAELTRRDELLERAVEQAHPIALWFEHDLYDQLQLIQILARLDARAVAGAEIVQADVHLGALDEAALVELWQSREPLSPEAAALGRDAWRAVCTDEVEAILARDTSALPHLAPALRRLLEERAPLSRTKRQLLTALRDGPRRPLQLFLANQEAEEAIFLGDTWCFLRLWELVQDGLVEPVGGALPLPPPRGDHEAFTAVSLELTPAGRELA